MGISVVGSLSSIDVGSLDGAVHAKPQFWDQQPISLMRPPEDQLPKWNAGDLLTVSPILPPAALPPSAVVLGLDPSVPEIRLLGSKAVNGLSVSSDILDLVAQRYNTIPTKPADPAPIAPAGLLDRWLASAQGLHDRYMGGLNEERVAASNTASNPSTPWFMQEEAAQRVRDLSSQEAWLYPVTGAISAAAGLLRNATNPQIQEQSLRGLGWASQHPLDAAQNIVSKVQDTVSNQPIDQTILDLRSPGTWLKGLSGLGVLFGTTKLPDMGPGAGGKIRELLPTDFGKGIDFNLLYGTTTVRLKVEQDQLVGGL